VRKCTLPTPAHKAASAYLTIYVTPAHKEAVVAMLLTERERKRERERERERARPAEIGRR
jgi:hypothetical protein